MLKTMRGGARIALFLGMLVTTVALMSSQTAWAQQTRLVALGASIVNGWGVGASQAWPAQLESQLRSRVNNVARVPAGTRIVIYNAGGKNNARRGISSTEAAGSIAAAIRARGATPIWLQYKGIPRMADGIHLTAAGHRQAAADLVPRVIAALGKKR
jgi:acyl-CoA thioesterase I